jgi:hypothetical protein
MPNLVDTWVRFTGTPNSLQTLLEKPFTFESWVPIPPELQEAENQTLYKWQKENWGATWISEDYEGDKPTPVRLRKQDDGSYECKFITPWSPPLDFLWKLLEIIPDLEIEYEYCDYMSCYCGFGTGPFESQNKIFTYETKEELESVWAERVWHVPICNPHLRNDDE